MAALTQHSLPSDIQLALQHAVGQANNAYNNHEAESGSGKKKSKKRAREGAQGEEIGEEVKKKKKKKKITREQLGAADAESIVSSEPSLNSLENASEEPTKKKKKKKDKGKQREVAQEELADTGSLSDAQAQSAAFINAVVSAASATAGMSQQPDISYGQPQFPMYPPPPHQPSYMPYGIPPEMANYSMDPPPADHSADQAPHSFPGTNLPPELLYGSNDDIVRALQDFDLTKIAGVLKTLGDAAAAANLPYSGLPSLAPAPQPGSHGPSQPHATATPSQRRQTQNRQQSRRITNIHVPLPTVTGDSEHAYILANKWMSTSKLAELVRTEGLEYKKGKFSAIEEQQLTNAIENFRAQKGLSEDQLRDIIFAKSSQAKDNSFWSEITSALHLRPIIAVYHHVRRRYHPLSAQGKWMPSEDEILQQAVAELGQQWEKVSDRVGRMASDCRDRWRNHIEHRSDKIYGPWTKEEENMLTQIVTDITVNQGKDMDNDVFWGVVSQRMGNKRGRQQCRIKWTDALSKTVKNQGQKPRWSAQDAFILVHKVDSLHVRDDSEIDWKTLPDANWNLWSPHTLQRRWLTMKRSIKGYEEMSHAEIMDILLVKKAHLPTERKRKVVSAEAIEDSEEEADDLLHADLSAVTTPAISVPPPPAVAADDSDSSSSSDSD